jgi:hypothetical protein
MRGGNKMLSASEMNKQAEKELDTFVTNLLKINGVAEYMGVDDDTYNYVKQEYIKKFYPIVHDLTFKLPVSNIWNK